MACSDHPYRHIDTMKTPSLYGPVLKKTFDAFLSFGRVSFYQLKSELFLGSSKIWSDKVRLLHNKAYGETGKTEGKTITAVLTAQKSDREVAYGELFPG